MKKKSNYYKRKKKEKRLYFIRRFIAFIILCIIAVILFNFIRGTLFREKTTYVDSEVTNGPIINKASLVMVGDALFHSAVYADGMSSDGINYDNMLSGVSDYIQGFDLAFYNQESILGGSEIGLSTYPCFNSPYEVGDAFYKAGFNIVSLANNHTLDRGVVAINNSVNYWKTHPDVLTAGSYSSYEDRDEIRVFEKNGITYTLLSYTDTTNGINIPSGKDYLVNKFDYDKAKSDIERVRDSVDVLLVSMHFGEEYTHNPTNRQRDIAKFLAENGVDIVIGHHPHVVQPIEFIDNTMVIYSLGNFISAQVGIERLTGLMASVDIYKTTYNDEVEIKLENVKAELTYTYSNRINGIRHNFKVYKYSDLNDSLLPNYQSYRDKYLGIVLSKLNIESGDNDGDSK